MRSLAVAKLNWGKAVERLAAQEVRDSPSLRSMFRHVGGPHRPDFVGVGNFEGMTFDITTSGDTGLLAR